MIEIDYSGIEQHSGVQPTNWKSPRHVYFGPKDPNTGQMQDEPVYTHQEFPRMLYRKKPDGVIAAGIVKNAEEMATMIEQGWETTPAAFGLVTAPSFDQVQAAKEQPEAPRRGRPPKE